MADGQGSTAFVTIPRRDAGYRPVAERLKDSREVLQCRKHTESQDQAARCLNCGVPFCSWACPTANAIFDWNRHMASGDWHHAYLALQATNPMPEVTGRICPAPCETACVLEISGDPVTIRANEMEIIDHAFEKGWVVPRPPARRTGKSVAVIGSGPAGLCCAVRLNEAGHRVVVFERDDRLGGLLRYGIPDFKMEKRIIDRRVEIWKQEGIEFVTGANVGVTLPIAKVLEEFDAVCLTGGARAPRDLPIPGRTLSGVHFAMEFLTQSNRRVAGDRIPQAECIDARDKQVVVLGGGDTGADCVGTSHRQGARQVVQVELLPQPPPKRRPDQPWPTYPTILRKSTSHEEGGRREWSVLTKEFLGSNGRVERLSCVKVNWTRDAAGKPVMTEVPESAFSIQADLVLLALGFVSPERPGLLTQLGVALDARGTVQAASNYQTSLPKVFAAGDMRRGQSLVVWAIQEGQAAAYHIDCFLTGHSALPLP